LGRPLPGLGLDIDATIVLPHPGKEAAAPNWKKHVRLPSAAVFPRRDRRGHGRHAPM
jgi:hypothetical protein